MANCQCCPLLCAWMRWLPVIILNAILRVVWRLPIHLAWLAWDAVLHPVLKMLLVLVWPRGAVSWQFWRIVFCSIWLEKIKMKTNRDAQKIADSVNGAKLNDAKDRDQTPLSLAAADFRQRISDELTVFSVVSVLLAGMTFAPVATPFDDNIQSGPVLDCFVVCCYLGAVLSVLLTGMYARLATVLRYCPGDKYIIWYIYRFEPTFALMHIVFMLNIHLVVVASSCALWNQWRCQFLDASSGPSLHPLAFSSLANPGSSNIYSTNTTNAAHATFDGCVSNSNKAMTGLFSAAGLCVLYFLYTWGNSLFCRHNGLCGLLDRAAAPEGPVDSQHICVLMAHCKDILAEEPFNCYRKAADAGDATFQAHLTHNNVQQFVPTLHLCDELPWPWPCPMRCFSEQDMGVRAPKCLAWCFGKCNSCMPVSHIGANDAVVTIIPDTEADACWYNTPTCSAGPMQGTYVNLHTNAEHNHELPGLFQNAVWHLAVGVAPGFYRFANGDQFDMVVSHSAGQPKWAVKIGDCTVQTGNCDTYAQGGHLYLHIRIDNITYNRQHFGLATQAQADKLPVNVMGLPNAADIPKTLGELHAHRPAVAAVGPAAAVPAVPGTYTWPLCGLLPHNTVLI